MPSDGTEPIGGVGWLVEMPDHMTDLVFPDDEYQNAFQHATGSRIKSLEQRDHVDYPGEERIRSIDFGEPTEVPIADV